MTKVDLTKLTADTIGNVLTIASQATVNVAIGKIPQVNQELATLESIGRKLVNGELVVVEPVKEDEDNEDDNSDTG